MHGWPLMRYSTDVCMCHQVAWSNSPPLIHMQMLDQLSEWSKMQKTHEIESHCAEYAVIWHSGAWGMQHNKQDQIK